MTTAEKALRHVMLPALATAAIVALYYTPLTAISCRDRGLLALAVLAISSVAAFVTVGVGTARQRRGDPGAGWWALSTAILIVPLALVLGPLG
jgi:hypothetical protein